MGDVAQKGEVMSMREVTLGGFLECQLTSILTTIIVNSTGILF